jgi:hypothetical protein
VSVVKKLRRRPAKTSVSDRRAVNGEGDGPLILPVSVAVDPLDLDNLS